MKPLFIALFSLLTLSGNCQHNPDEDKSGYEYFALVPNRLLSFKKDKVAITDNKGKEIVPYNYLVGDYMWVFNWDGELYADSATTFQMLNEDSLMAIYNVYGDCLFDFKYKYIQSLNYKCEEGEHRFITKEGDKYTFKTKDDKTMVEGLVFDELLGYWHKTDVYVVMNNNEILFVDLCKGESFKSFVPTDGNRFDDFKHNGKVGLVSCSGQIVIPFEFKEFYYYGGSDPTFPTYHENGQGIADTNGVEIIPAKYDYVERFCSQEIGNDIGHPFLAKKGEYHALLVYDKEAKVFKEKTDFIFKRLNCDYDDYNYEYINRVETKEGKKGVLSQDGTIKWE